MWKKYDDEFKRNALEAENLLAHVPQQEYVAVRVIIGDITYIRLRGGKFCYLAVWQDKVMRRIIGWSLGLEMTAGLVISALEKALNKGKIKRGAIIHSDRGSQYAPGRFSRFVGEKRFAAKYERQRKLL